MLVWLRTSYQQRREAQLGLMIGHGPVGEPTAAAHKANKRTYAGAARQKQLPGVVGADMKRKRVHVSTTGLFMQPGNELRAILTHVLTTRRRKCNR